MEKAKKKRGDRGVKTKKSWGYRIVQKSDLAAKGLKRKKKLPIQSLEVTFAGIHVQKQ